MRSPVSVLELEGMQNILLIEKDTRMQAGQDIKDLVIPIALLEIARQLTIRPIIPDRFDQILDDIADDVQNSESEDHASEKLRTAAMIMRGLQPKVRD